MKRILFFIMAAVTAIPGFAQEQEKGADLKVMTYNIRMATLKDGPNAWIYRREASIEMIKDQKPDVFAMQEVMFRQKKYFDVMCYEDYQGVGVGRENGKKKGEHTTIHWNKKTLNMLGWGTLWLSETPEKPSVGWDAWHPRTFTWALLEKKDSGKKFYFVNVHLDHAGGQAQKNGLALAKAKMDELNVEGYPVIIVGDFNVTPSNGIISDFNTKMKNAKLHAAEADAHETFNDWGKRLITLDYIYYDGLSKCHSFDVVTEEYAGKTLISDHYPVTAEFTF
ncbi:MAG: endonuclease/exonuclease/phosphatase family protein [Bacteroidales bacterium]|nr:endonuclease/exonuclease/phosphatase family protein [Bacteroidales bacterium]